MNGTTCDGRIIHYDVSQEIEDLNETDDEDDDALTYALIPLVEPFSWKMFYRTKYVKSY